MKTFTLCLFLFNLVGLAPVKAQIIGNEALHQLQNGEVSFLEGEFIVFLKDTVSPTFIEKKFKELHYSISFVDIHPIRISIVNSPSDSVLEKLKTHPLLMRSFTEPEAIDTAYFEGILSEQGLLGEQYNATLARLLSAQSSSTIYFEFDYAVNSVILKKIMSNFRSVAYQIEKDFPRSINISCEPGKEQELMEKLDLLPFVESTALIGVLGGLE